MATAYPDIRVNSSTGSNTLASGAGPGDGITSGSALTGTAGVTNVGGTVVTLDGSPNLTSVATDGSHCIWFNDATAGNNKWATITATANSGTPTAQVTVTPALGGSLTKAWAIGGKRASLEGSTELFNNNSAAGDLSDIGGGSVTMEDGYTETLTTTLKFYWNCTVANGAITLRGDPSASTVPVVTGQSGNSNVFNIMPSGATAEGIVFSGFNIVGNTGTTKSNSSVIAIVCTGSLGSLQLRNMVIGGTGNTTGFYRGIYNFQDMAVTAYNVTIRNCYDSAGDMAGGGAYAHRFIGCVIDECDHGAGNGYGLTGLSGKCVIANTVVARCRGAGLRFSIAENDGAHAAAPVVLNCTIYKNGGDGIVFAHTSSQRGMQMAAIVNNSITHNGGYGIDFTGAGITAANVAAFLMLSQNNNFGTGGTANTSGSCNLTLTSGVSVGALSVDPAYVDADNATDASRDFRPGTNLKAAGFPAVNAGFSSVRGYLDVGAWQRQEPASGGGVTGVIGS